MTELFKPNKLTNNFISEKQVSCKSLPPSHFICIVEGHAAVNDFCVAETVRSVQLISMAEDLNTFLFKIIKI